MQHVPGTFLCDASPPRVAASGAAALDELSSRLERILKWDAVVKLTGRIKNFVVVKMNIDMPRPFYTWYIARCLAAMP